MGPETSERIVVIGAGVMGHGIAQVAASSGFDAVLVDVSPSALTAATKQVRANLDKGIRKGKVTEAERDAALGRLTTASDFAQAAPGAALVVEAAPEDMALKLEIFGKLGRLCGPETILATNTSSLAITEIAAATRHPERVLGAHFFNPPHIVKLLEIITAYQTSEEALTRLRQIGERLGREIIVVRDSPGFATSRLGLVLGLEAIRMVEAGVAEPADIDRAMELGYRHPMGPLRLTDLVGLDTRLKIAEYLYRELGGEQFRPPPLLRKLVRAGRLGRKSGAGFYEYD